MIKLCEADQFGGCEYAECPRKQLPLPVVCSLPLIEPAHWIWRLPIIRAIRTLWNGYEIARQDMLFRNMGMIPTSSFDKRVLLQMWRGIV